MDVTTSPPLEKLFEAVTAATLHSLLSSVTKIFSVGLRSADGLGLTD